MVAFILVSERLFQISPNTLSVSVSEMLSPFAEPVSRLLEFPERRKTCFSIRERVVRAGLPPCLPPNRIKAKVKVLPPHGAKFQLDRPPLEGGIAFC